jgi:hypothetical protein
MLNIADILELFDRDLYESKVLMQSGVTPHLRRRTA